MSALKGRRVLVVEDDLELATLLDEYLAGRGIVVVGPAFTLLQAELFAEQLDIDAAILDVSLQADRVDPLAGRLRERGIPFVLATGLADAINAQPAGTICLRKPYTLAQLEAALVRAMGEPTTA